MAIYDGFFDAQLVEVEKDGRITEEFDRTYEPEDFTNYFGQIIGSGVCIYKNPDSMKVSFADGAAVVAPGYLFIQGYWLKNDSDYAVPLSGAGAYAIAAHLSLADRRIDIEAREKAESYPDCLVLAYVTVDSTGGAVVEDTRADETVCGIIDSMGEMSQKVAWAVEYIDTEINAKLEQAEADIAAQSQLLDTKIAEVEAEVNKLQPPPIGTIKFSASQNVEEGWLHCDGSFVSEADYPELVAALGKLTPGVEDFKEIANGEYQGTFSNSVLDSGAIWTFSLSENKLIGYPTDGTAKREIQVEGTGRLVSSTANIIVLSICGDTVFLAQNRQSRNAFVLLEATGFSKTANTLTFNELPIASAFDYSDVYDNAIPEVVKGVYSFSGSAQSEAFYLCYGRSIGGMSSSTSENKPIEAYSLVWKAGDFSTHSKRTVQLYSQQYSTNKHLHYIDTFFRYSRKNSNDMFYVRGVPLDSPGNYPETRIYTASTPLGLYNSPGYKEVKINYGGDSLATISPVAGNNAFIYRFSIENNQLHVTAGKINPIEPFADDGGTALSLHLPSLAKLFPDSACLCASQSLWVIFVGTGFVFSQDPLNANKWGYLDTSKTLGVITQFGWADYDDKTQTLCIAGCDTTNHLKVGLLKFKDIYDYANDGAFLPNIASDGVPAYIKAKEIKPDVPDVIVDPVSVTVTVQPPAYYFDSHADIIFNGERLIAGTYTRTLSESGTFSAGFRVKDAGGNYNTTVTLNGATIVSKDLSEVSVGDEVTASFKVSDFAAKGITLKGTTV